MTPLVMHQFSSDVPDLNRGLGLDWNSSQVSSTPCFLGILWQAALPKRGNCCLQPGWLLTAHFVIEVPRERTALKHSQDAALNEGEYCGFSLQRSSKEMRYICKKGPSVPRLSSFYILSLAALSFFWVWKKAPSSAYIKLQLLLLTWLLSMQTRFIMRAAFFSFFFSPINFQWNNYCCHALKIHL